MAHPLVTEAMKKAAVAWIAAGAEPPRALWCLAVDGALWVVTGPGEQAAPGLATAETVVVTLRGDHGGRIVTWPAAVTRIDPASEAWTEVVPQLAGKRLNAPTVAAGLVDRWAAECTVLRLTPLGDPAPAGGGPLDTNEAMPVGGRRPSAERARRGLLRRAPQGARRAAKHD